MSEGIVLWKPENAGEQTINISVELDKRPPSDAWGNWHGSVFEDGWFTYACLVYGNEDSDEWFQEHVVWPRPAKAQPLQED